MGGMTGQAPGGASDGLVHANFMTSAFMTTGSHLFFPGCCEILSAGPRLPVFSEPRGRCSASGPQALHSGQGRAILSWVSAPEPTQHSGGPGSVWQRHSIRTAEPVAPGERLDPAISWPLSEGSSSRNMPSQGFLSTCTVSQRKQAIIFPGAV